MKKAIAILCSLALIFSLYGCGSNMQDSNTTTVDNNTSSNIIDNDNKERKGAMTTTNAIADPVFSPENYSTGKVVWGPGSIHNHQQPADPLALQKEFSKLGAKWLLDDEKSICLTFDEGYENGYTPRILDILKEKNVKAIFFVTYDFASSNKELIQRMIDEGHIVGNHTYRHLTMDEVDTATAKEEITYLHKYIKKNFDYTMSYFRFPKGEFSQQSLAIANELGYKSIFWSYAYADWDPDHQPEQTSALQGICESTHAGEILLLHAVSQTNAEILGAAIDDIRQQGYTFVTDI